MSTSHHAGKKQPFFRRLSFSTASRAEAHQDASSNDGIQIRLNSSPSQHARQLQGPTSPAEIINGPPPRPATMNTAAQLTGRSTPGHDFGVPHRNIYPALASPPYKNQGQDFHQSGSVSQPSMNVTDFNNSNTRTRGPMAISVPGSSQYDDAVEVTSLLAQSRLHQIDSYIQPATTRSSRHKERPPPSAYPSAIKLHSYPGSHEAISEASAYARAITQSQVDGSAPHRKDTLSAPPQVPANPKTSRPLPQTPSATVSPSKAQAVSLTRQRQDIRDTTGTRAPPHLTEQFEALLSGNATGEFCQEDSTILFSKSPSLPSLLDPRKSSNRHTTLLKVFSLPRVQACILPALSINTFLSLMGTSDALRASFTGESVGRWVLKEWGFQLDRERGRSWPNLNVWEGFLESMLHDPATYHTYAPHWHNLLRHLALSYTLIVLHLRLLPASCFPNSASNGDPFDEDLMPNRSAQASAVAGSSSATLSRGLNDNSWGPGTQKNMPRQEHLVEIVMPEPLAVQEPSASAQRHSRRGSVDSVPASKQTSLFARRRSSSISSRTASGSVGSGTSAPMVGAGKAALPPVSYPTAKRYNFVRHGDASVPGQSRTLPGTSRPGSMYSVQTGASVALSQWLSNHQHKRSIHPSTPSAPVSMAAVPLGAHGSVRASYISSDTGRRDSPIPFAPESHSAVEPAFDRPSPFMQGRAPVLRVFVPVGRGTVSRWPSVEGAAAAVAELDKCGATKRMKLGDLIVNTAIPSSKSTEHVLVYVPFVKYLLVPLAYRFNPYGHLPAYVDGFTLPPTYFYPFLPDPIVLHLDLRSFAARALPTLRLAFDRRDVTVSSGARVTARRYLFVAGFAVSSLDNTAPEWEGMVSLEAEGTAEGKAELLRRLDSPSMGPWEVVRQKSMSGMVWLRLMR